MFYDTLREDGTYRVGGTQATKTGCPILPPKEAEPWEGELGEKELFKRSGLAPINNIGSRIIIIDPIDEVREQLVDGTFLKAIEETWFRTIEKQTLEVLVTFSGKTHYAKVPYPYPLPDEDNAEIKTWILGSDFADNTLVVYGEKFRIKNFHATYHNKDVEFDENIQGISIVHNGMKICTVEMNSAPPNVKEKITGFIEFDQKLERELRKGENQHPNHYNLKWRRKIPHEIRSFIQQQLEEFGKVKLNLGADPREVKKRKRTNAEDWAMRQLLRHARDLDLFGAKGISPPRIDTPPTPPKILGISINNFIFPSPEIAPRINWGQKFEDITITAFNRTDNALHVSMLTQILHGDSLVLQPIERVETTLDPHSKYRTNAFDVDILDYLYTSPGLYRISASLFDAKTGDRLDRVTRKFWVERDPPLRQPFILQPLPEFPEPHSYRQWFTSGSINNSPTLYYNVSHPAYLAIEEDDSAQAEYILDIVLSGAMDFVLKRPNHEDGSPDFHPLLATNILGEGQPFERDEVPSKTYDELSSYISEIRWRVFDEAY